MANMTFKASLLPNTDLGYSLGSSTQRWNIYGNLTGNAATATKLQTARTINGTSFDGTANITTANWGTARNISISDSDATNTGAAVSVNGSAAVTLKLPATIKASLTGNATTCTYPLGFNGRNTNATWGNQTGATVTAWNESKGGSIDFRNDNPSSGKLSVKVDGRFYGNEGNYPAMLMNYTNSFWGMGDPDGANNVWIRTTSNGIIPYQGGSAGSGHGSLGTSSWYFHTAYIDTVYGNLTGVAAKATADASGNTITSTYVKKSGDDMTGSIRQKFTNYTRNVTPSSNLYRTYEFIDSANTRIAQVECGLLTTGINRLHLYVLGNITSTSTNNYSGLIIQKASGNTGNGSCTLNANAGTITGAVWNDYAEYRQSDIEEPGRCIKETGHGNLILTEKRLERGCEIISDTFGFAIGKNDECQTPTACSGRVLAYLLEDNEYAKDFIGWPVCSGPNGTVSIMTEEEEKEYPSRIIGTISEIPDYDIWYAGGNESKEASTPIEVNGRIWIRIH